MQLNDADASAQTQSPMSPLASHCAACGRALTDDLSVRLGIGPDCRRIYGFDQDLDDATRAEVNKCVYRIALLWNSDKEATLAAAVDLLHLGMGALADRVQRRIELKSAVAAQQKTVTGAPHVTAISEQAPDTAIPEAAKQPLPFALTDGQSLAVDMVKRLVKRNKGGAAFIVGYAGTGKTTLLRVLAQEFGRSVIITPTGKAALRVREATGLAAQTIHRWIYKPVEDMRTGTVYFVRRAENEVERPPSGLVIVDEASMVGSDVWTDVWDMCQYHGLCLVCIGDGFQLAPVQGKTATPFSVLTPAFAQALGAERSELTEVLRQAQGSPVIRVSMALRSPGFRIKDLRDLPQITPEAFADTAVATLRSRGVVICFKNDTRFKLNAGIRKHMGILNPLPEPGEPLMVLKNNYGADVMNGETVLFPGWVEDGTPSALDVVDKYKFNTVTGEPLRESVHYGGIELPSCARATLAIEQLHGQTQLGLSTLARGSDIWRSRSIADFGEVSSHVHANFGYAYTAHKSQGSQWPYVLVVLEPSVRIREEEGRRWAYTAITRAEQLTAIYHGSI